MEAGPPVGVQPRKAGWSGVQIIDFQPLLWIESPVRISSVVDPYIHPTYTGKRKEKKEREHFRLVVF